MKILRFLIILTLVWAFDVQAGVPTVPATNTLGQVTMVQATPKQAGFNNHLPPPKDTSIEGAVVRAKWEAQDLAAGLPFLIQDPLVWMLAGGLIGGVLGWLAHLIWHHNRWHRRQHDGVPVVGSRA